MKKTVLYNLPPSVKGFCREDADGFQTIVLNSNLSYEDNVKSYIHETNHKKDFVENDVNQLESVRHK